MGIEVEFRPVRGAVEVWKGRGFSPDGGRSPGLNPSFELRLRPFLFVTLAYGMLTALQDFFDR